MTISCKESMNVNNENTKKELPINKEPIIRGLAHHADMCSICESSISVGDMTADVDILDSDINKKWNISTNNSKTIFKNNNLKVYNDKYDDNMQVYMYRKCYSDDELIIKVNYQQYTFAFASISIVVDSKPFLANNDRKFSFEYGNFSKTGIHACINEILQPINNITDVYYPIYLKLNKKKNRIIVSSSKNRKNWIEHGQYEVNENNTLYMGVNISMIQNQWYNWLFTNFIQIKCNPNSDNIHADYYVSLSKNYKYNNLNMFLDYNNISKNFIINFYGNIKKFIKLSINNNYYIEISLNEYYLKGRNSYHNINRNHINLIYGYDNNLKIFLSMGIDTDGYLCFTNISYSDFDNSLKNCNNKDDIVTIKYNPDCHIFELNLSYMIKFLKDYLKGYNSSIDCSGLVPATQEQFGIKIYDVYLLDNNFNIFLGDIRISYTIYEHKKIMHERIKFLLKRRVIDDSDGSEFLIQTKELLDLSNKIMMLVLKNLIKEDNRNKSKIYQFLYELKEKEILCYERLIEALAKNIK